MPGARARRYLEYRAIHRLFGSACAIRSCCKVARAAPPSASDPERAPLSTGPAKRLTELQGHIVAC